MGENEQHNRLTQFITGLTATSFAYGVIYLRVFSACFNFNYFDFVDLNEIVTHVLKDFVMLSIPYTIVVAAWYGLGEWKVVISHKNLILGRYLTLAAAICGLVFIYLIIQFIDGKLILSRFILFSAVDIFWKLLLSLPAGVYFSRLNVPVSIKYFLAAFIFVITFAGAIIKSSKSAIRYQINKASFGTYIITPTDTIKSDSSYYYIGQTSKYFFFYNENSHSTDAYPEKDVIKFSLHIKTRPLVVF